MTTEYHVYRCKVCGGSGEYWEGAGRGKPDTCPGCSKCPDVEFYYLTKDGTRVDGPPPTFGYKDLYLDGSINGALLYFRDAYSARFWEPDFPQPIDRAFFKARWNKRTSLEVEARMEGDDLILRVKDGKRMIAQ